ncbi:hypothetical protein MRM63_09935 [bacterium 19MO03SA05]|uniref:Uncharacterized protein n=1 Tax=bacterium 19MO03SA05 TaxID=2920620 RepID=A0AAU6VF00_UNCXX|nr:MULTISPECIES: hypothetical protein [unclassified Vibrio]EKO3921866.1 hypothetical protein [Vibrio metschnikovii]MDQ2110124.1 hypothetical protein [Vibrio sp. 2017_1457_15]MDQ2162926.1 hypothetical protein [Vibrio sp. 2017_1457_13]MDQ2194720.1 hypothetical protein [Vibrio sp. A14(2019)]
MSEMIEAVPTQNFQQPLNNAEQEMVEVLVTKYKNDVVVTQQLAMDASRLFSCSEERLKQQVESGFFKRFFGALNGQNSENQLQNQVDVLQMQKFAWHYLQQLQQQNLINAQGIAVIRNNLGTMNEYIIETRDFLIKAVDKINRRLIRVENNSSFHQWSLSIEANKRRFKSMPKVLLVLNLTYDFMRSHPGIMLTSEDINHLIVILEKLEVDCDQDVKLLDFILDLIDKIEVSSSIDRYRSLIELSYNEHLVDSYFIQKNISGLAFNSLYYLSDEYDRIIDLLSDIEVCDTDKKRERIVSRFFGREFSGLETQYRMRDLIEEIIGGSLLTLDFYKNERGLNLLADDAIKESDDESVTLICSLPVINTHTFFDTSNNTQAGYNYLLLFALCVDSSETLSKESKAFIKLLGDKAGLSPSLEQIMTLISNPLKMQEYLPTLRALLDNDDIIYTWLLDVFYFLTLCQKPLDTPYIARILQELKPAKLKEQFPHILVILTEQDEEKVLLAAEKIQQQSHGWKNIVRYRELRFEQSFFELKNRLDNVRFDSDEIEDQLSDLEIKAMDYDSYNPNDWDFSLIDKAFGKISSSYSTIGRTSCLSSLNSIKNKYSEFISNHRSIFYQGNNELKRWGFSSIDFKHEIGYRDFELDNSSTNEEWYEQFCHFERQLTNTLHSFHDACRDLASQLSLFIDGNFNENESILELKKRKYEEQLEQEQQEKLTKQAVVIEKDDCEHLLSIEWSQIEQPPCDPEDIKDIKTDGTIWLIVDYDSRVYRSLDCENWDRVCLSDNEENTPYIRKLVFVADIWIAFSGYSEGFYYSQDAKCWKQSNYPEGFGYELNATEDICCFNGLWLWRFTERSEFTYVKKGLIFDSNETCGYARVKVFCTSELDKQWKPWKDTPNFAEGIEVTSIQRLPSGNALLAFCTYSWLYKNLKKKNNATSFVSYFIEGKGWRTCTWESEDDNYSTPIITNIGHNLLCLYSDKMMESDQNGYEWRLKSEGFYVNALASLDHMSLFWNYKSFYVSPTGKEFHELVFEDGSWNHIAANKQGLISVYSPNSHETFLRRGCYIYKPKI